jgi:hypothetical protein
VRRGFIFKENLFPTKRPPVAGAVVTARAAGAAAGTYAQMSNSPW